MDLSNLGKWIFLLGLSIAFVGAAFWLISKTGLPFGKIPGDIVIKREKFSFYFPVVTCIILSIILTVIINVLITFFRK